MAPWPHLRETPPRTHHCIYSELLVLLVEKQGSQRAGRGATATVRTLD